MIGVNGVRSLIRYSSDSVTSTDSGPGSKRTVCRPVMVASSTSSVWPVRTS
jgi:hypothetical protein